MDIAALIEKMAVLFFSILTGYLAARAGVLSTEGNRQLSRLLVNVANPLLIVSSVLRGEHLLANAEVLALTGLIVCCYACTIALGLLVPRLLRAPQEQRGTYQFMFIFSNIGFMGYPVVASLFGASAIFYVSLFVLFFQLLCWSYGVSLISGAPKFRFERKVLKQPCLIAALFAYVFYLSGLRAPELAYKATSYVGELTSPLAMLVIGSSLAQMDLRKIFGNWRIYVLCALKMVVVPLLMYAVLRLVIQNQLMLGVTMVTLCMPVATNTTIISYQNHGDDALASSGVFLTTLLSVVSIPLIMSLLFR